MLLKIRILIALATFAAVTVVNAQDDSKLKTSAATNAPASTNSAAKTAAVKQADVASKTAKFDSVSKTNDLYKTALDPHALQLALQQVNNEGAFKGTVTGVYEPRGGAMAILNFDQNYRNALTALVWKENFTKFPALTSLTNKEVVVAGKFINYQGRAEIVLTNAAQIKLVQ